MILIGSQRGGGAALAAHLLNDRENDHVTVHELRGFVGTSLREAMDEAHAIAKGTQAKQYLFSLSLNPPKDGDASLDDLLAAADRAEAALGLTGKPRGIVIHEKKGRRHLHVVWSRIDAATMTAINMPFFKTRLNALARELYLDHGWPLPEGFRTNGWKNPLNFTLAEWQQAKRLDLDPREIKQIFAESWAASDSFPAFRAALEQSGYYLARGDRRAMVAVDVRGEVFSVSRWAGLKARDIRARLGARGIEQAEALPGVDAVRNLIRERMRASVQNLAQDARRTHDATAKPLDDEHRRMVAAQRAERLQLEKAQKERADREARDRAARFRKGFGFLVDYVTGRVRSQRVQNETEAWQSVMRDRAQREAVARAQLIERSALEKRIAAIRDQQRQERRETVRKVAEVWRAIQRSQPQRLSGPRRHPGLSL